MPSCPELGRLPKAVGIRSLNFKRITPGSVYPLLFPASSRHRKVLDPAHIANKIPAERRRNIFPQYTSDAFQLSAFPSALRAVPEDKWPDPPFHYDSKKGGSYQLNMALCRETPLSLHPSAVGRDKIMYKIKNAISLIVVRGAHVKEDKGKPTIFFNEADVGEKWLLDEWTYIARPQLRVFRMSYGDLIPLLREALSTIKEKGDAIEAAWARGHPHPKDTGQRHKHPGARPGHRS